MGDKASFYGEIISMDVLEDSYSFEMLDIYVSQKNKWLKEDSFAASKLFTNMEILKAAGSFSFFTVSGSEGHFFKDIAAKNKTFRIGISAFVWNYQLRVLCFDCELIQAMLAPAPNGTFQGYAVKFKDAMIKQIAEPPVSKSRRYRTFPISVFDPWSSIKGEF